MRKLAERTVTATSEISDITAKIHKETGHAVQTMDQGRKQVQEGEEHSRQAEAALTKVVKEIETIQGMITQIAAATEEQSSAAGEISSTIDQLVKH